MANRTYAFVLSSFTSSINFNEILQSSPSTMRRSLDGSMVVVKWNNPRSGSDDPAMPPSISESDLVTISGSNKWDWSAGEETQYRSILAGPNWTSPDEI